MKFNRYLCALACVAMFACGCNDDEKVTVELECGVDDVSKCDTDGKQLLVCQNQTWVKGEICEYGCDSQSGTCKKNDITKCTKDCNSVGGRAEVCVKLNGVEQCKPTCLRSEEGSHMVCYSNMSLDPDSREVFSVNETCTKDDLGTLYSASSQSTMCEGGCAEDTGLCAEKPAEKCSLNCTIDGGRAEVCVKIDGEELCKPACLGNKEGEVKACYRNGSVADPIDQAVAETCAKDDLGTLYSVNADYTECPEGCTDGVCVNAVPSPVGCENNCQSVGGRAEVCVNINGADQCKPTCLGNKEGENLSCYRNASLGPNAPQYAVNETCVKDGNGTLYAASADYTECPEGCTDGVCVNAVPSPVGCEHNCQSVGGRAEVCVNINGTDQCKPTCLGNKEGENLSCYRNASLGPNAPQYAVNETCVKDGNGTLYAASADYTECPEGCTDGACD